MTAVPGPVSGLDNDRRPTGSMARLPVDRDLGVRVPASGEEDPVTAATDGPALGDPPPGRAQSAQRSIPAAAAVRVSPLLAVDPDAAKARAADPVRASFGGRSGQEAEKQRDDRWNETRHPPGYRQELPGERPPNGVLG